MRTFHASHLPTISTLVGRLLRFDFSVFDDVRSNPATTTPAILVVAGASFLSGLGSWLWWITRGHSLVDFGAAGDVFVRSFILGSLFQVGVWFLWVYLAYQILARVHGVHADFYEMIRVMGFAFVPMGLMALMVISPLAIPLALIAVIVTVLFTNAAIQSTTTADAQQVLMANVAGFVVFAVVLGILANIGQVSPFGGLAPGIFFFTLD